MIQQMKTILDNMSDDNIRKLASTLISRPQLTDTETVLAEWVMDDITGRKH